MRQITKDEGRRTKDGFTLIEMMVVVGIFTIMMGIAFTAIRLNETYRDLTFIRIQLYRQNKRAHDAIREELEKSQLSRVNITSPTPDAIRFQIPLVNSIDNTTYAVPWGARYNDTDYSGYYIRYMMLNATSAYLVRDLLDSALAPVSGTAEIKANNIVDLQFSNVTANCTNCIGISTTARKATLSPPRNITDSMNSTVYLLN